MTSSIPDPRRRTLEGLARLRAAFPLEARLAAADAPVRDAYVLLLRRWTDGTPPDHDAAPPEALTALLGLDAVVLHPDGVSCYPFSLRPTAIRVSAGGRSMYAMCAVDALAIARLLNAASEVAAACAGCGTPIRLRINNDGGLDHDQLDRATVWWAAHAPLADRSADGLCRRIRFLCSACSAAPEEMYSLPEAAAIGNAFFAFQRALLADGNGG